MVHKCRKRYNIHQLKKFKVKQLSHYVNQSDWKKLKAFSIPVRKSLGKGHSFSAGEQGNRSINYVISVLCTMQKKRDLNEWHSTISGHKKHIKIKCV